MGKKVLVHYKPEGAPLREFVTTIPRLLAFAVIFAGCLVFTVASIANYVMESFTVITFQPETAAAALIQQNEKTPQAAPVVTKTQDKAPPAPKVIPQTKIASLTASEEAEEEPAEVPIKVALDIPDSSDSVAIKTTDDEEDERNLFVHFQIENKSDKYARGYTYGLAVYVDENGNESLIPSHPGIDTDAPFAKERFITALSYGARRFTNKTLSFDRPDTTGTFTKVWIVASNGTAISVEPHPLR